MKTINKWALGIALMAGLASCEMKDELLGDSVLSGDTGFLALNVATANVSTKGTTDQVDEFPVTIKGKDVEYTKTYDSYAELKKEESIELPVGTFTIEAHSPVEFEDVMSEPYYGGTKDITITKGVTSEEEVQCKIQNVKITMSYTAAFLETYESWTITVNDKKGHVEVFTNENGTEPASVYWKLDGTVETIYIEGKAVNKTTKEEVSIYGTAKKTNLPGYEDDDDTAFVGGDELKIEANPVQVEGSTPGVEKEGIEINVSGFDSETNEEILIDVEQGTNTPGEGGEEGDGDGEETPDPQPGEGPTIQLPGDITYSISAGDAPESAIVRIESSDKFESIVVKIVAGNEGFNKALEDLQAKQLDFINGVNIVDNPIFQGLMSDLGQNGTVTKEDTSFNFEIAAFFSMMEIYKTTDAGKSHQFVIIVTDQKEKTADGILNVTINE